MLSKAHLTSHSRMSGSRWGITPSWLSGPWRSFLYSSSMYSCHLTCLLLIFIYFVVLGLSCSTQDLCCIMWNLSLWHTDSLVWHTGSIVAAQAPECPGLVALHLWDHSFLTYRDRKSISVWLWPRKGWLESREWLLVVIRVYFQNDKNVLKLIVRIIANICEYVKKHGSVYTVNGRIYGMWIIT